MKTEKETILNLQNQITSEIEHLDVLINNAGIMMCPYSTTEDGFEIQMGTNHLGPFALTGYLMPLLLKTSNSRIVNTSSIAHRQGNIDFSDSLIISILKKWKQAFYSH